MQVSFWKELTTVEVYSEAGCTIATAQTGVGPFADNSTGATSVVDYPLQYVFVNNHLQQRSVCSRSITVYQPGLHKHFICCPASASIELSHLLFRNTFCRLQILHMLPDIAHLHPSVELSHLLLLKDIA